MRLMIKLFQMVLLVLVLLSGVPGIFFLPAEQTWLHSRLTEEKLLQAGLYEKLPGILAQLAVQNPPAQSSSLAVQLKAADYRRLFTALLPADYLRAQSEAVLDQLWGILDNPKQTMLVSIDLREIKSRLGEPQNQAVAGLLLDSLAPCTNDDAAKIAGSVAKGDLNNLPACRPPDLLRPLALILVQSALGTMAKGIPDRIDLASLEPVVASSGTSSQTTQITIERLRLFLEIWSYLPALALGLWLILGLLSLPDTASALRWWGAGLVLVGMAGLVGAFLLSLAEGGLLQNFTVTGPSGPLTELQGLFAQVLDGVFGEFIRNAGSYSMIAFGLGLAAMLGGVLLSRRRAFDLWQKKLE